MCSRLLAVPERSFFLFGPRGTGKSAWLGTRLRDALVFDLLQSGMQQLLAAAPDRLAGLVPEGHAGWVVLDEILGAPRKPRSGGSSRQRKPR